MTRALLLVCLALAPQAYAQEARPALSNVDRLQALIETSSQSRDPNIAFITGFGDWPDFAMDQLEIRQALAQSALSPDVPLHSYLSDAISIRKERGKRVKMESAHEHVFAMEGGSVRFKKKIEFDLTSGSIEDIRDDDRRERLRAASPGGYTWINEVKNIHVSEGDGFYALYDLYYVREHSGTIVAWLKAGKFGMGPWTRIAFEDDAEVVGEGFDGSPTGGAIGALGDVVASHTPGAQVWA